MVSRIAGIILCRYCAKLSIHTICCVLMICYGMQSVASGALFCCSRFVERSPTVQHLIFRYKFVAVAVLTHTDLHSRSTKNSVCTYVSYCNCGACAALCIVTFTLDVDHHTQKTTPTPTTVFTWIWETNTVAALVTLRVCVDR